MARKSAWREVLIEQDAIHATRFKSTNSSSTEAAA